MVLSKDDVILKQLNKELKKYKIKLNFRYYDICPFKDHKLEVMNIVIKYSKELESYHNKIFILSSLSDEEFKNAIPYLIDIYFYFLNNIYGMPRDEIYLFYLYETISKIKSFEHKELYKKILCGPINQYAESIIKMVSNFNMQEFDDIIFNLIKKENLIPNLWIGELNEDCKYWCSYIAMKCIVQKKDKKYLNFFKEIIDDNEMAWIKFSNSKYGNKLTNKCKNEYKKLAKKGYDILMSLK